MKKFFNSKTTLVCFIIYVILTAFIFSQSLSSGTASSNSSGRVAGFISQIVEVVSGNKVTLIDDGKIKTLYPKEISVSGIDGELEVGKTYQLTVNLLPKNEYPLCDLNFTSSNQNVVTVDKDGLLTAVNVGQSQVTVKDRFSSLSKTIDVTVGNKVYIPKITFGSLTGFSQEDNAVYYSSANQTGAIYSIEFESEIESDNLIAYGEGADVVLGNGRVYFYPKKIGDITIKITADYLTVNGREQRDYLYTVSVNDKLMPAYSTPLIVSENAITITTTQTKTINLNLTEYQNGLTSAQKRIFYTVDSRFLTITNNGNELNLTPKKIGTSQVCVYYISNNSLLFKTVDVEILQGVPNTVKILAPSSWAINGKDLTLSVIGDGKKFDASEFNWTVNGSATVTNGKFLCEKNGSYTVTATHKTIEGFTATKTIQVKYSYHTYVRKLIGHFSLFFVLAIFAIVVYYRLAEILKPTKKALLGTCLTLSAGLVTASVSELLQSGIFTSGRAPSILDVSIDFAGYLLATTICFIIYIIYRKRNRKI